MKLQAPFRLGAGNRSRLSLRPLYLVLYSDVKADVSVQKAHNYKDHKHKIRGKLITVVINANSNHINYYLATPEKDRTTTPHFVPTTNIPVSWYSSRGTTSRSKITSS